MPSAPRSSTLIRGLFGHPDETRKHALASRLLHGFPVYRGQMFVHRRPWKELSGIPLLTYDEFVGKHGTVSCVEELLGRFRNPETITASDTIARLAHKYALDFYPKELDQRDVWYWKGKLHSFPLGNQDQYDVGVEAVVIRFGRIRDQDASWPDYFFVHYLEPMWSLDGYNPWGHEVFDDYAEEIDYAKKSGFVRPRSEPDFRWDVVEFHEDSQRRWYLGLSVDSGSVGPLVSFRDARRKHQDAEVRIRRELGMLIEPSRQKHTDIKKRIFEDDSQPGEMIRIAGEDYERAGVEVINGQAYEMIWIEFPHDGHREKTHIPASKKNPPITHAENILKGQYGLTFGDIHRLRSDPSYMDEILERRKKTEEEYFRKLREDPSTEIE